MSLADGIFGEPSELLAVLYCDLSQGAATDPESDDALWRVNYFRGARKMAADHGGQEATTAAGGWAATFDSTVEALVCARELSSLVGWQTGGPSLSGGLSAGEVTRNPFGISGNPVWEAIALCRRAQPRQVLVADPLKVVVSRETAGSLAPEPAAPAGRPLRLVRDPDVRRARTPAADSVRARLSVLGWVQLDGGARAARRVVMRGSQARAVLSMLALRHGPVHKDELAELLWPGALPEHWDGALRGLITKVRRFLASGGLPGREVLVGEDGYYELRLPPGVTVDRDEARALIGRAEAALCEGRPTEAAALVADALAILERRLLSGQDNAWFDQVRTELAQDRLAALDLWASADLEAGSTEGAKRAATAALSLDPYRESSYRLLMQAQAAAGSRGEALRTYERCRRMLADELGVAPAAQTQTLYVHLLG